MALLPQYQISTLFQVNSIIQKVDEWKSEAVSHFVRKESTDSLLDVLLPRQTSKPLTPRKKQQMKKASRQQRLLKNREKDNSSVMADRLLDSVSKQCGLWLCTQHVLQYSVNYSLQCYVCTILHCSANALCNIQYMLQCTHIGEQCTLLHSLQ